MWSWRYYITSTSLISLIWVKSCKFTCLLNLVTIDLIEMEISILISNLTWTSWKKLNSQSRSAIFKITDTDLQFQSPGYDWQENKNTGNCKAFCVSSKRENVLNLVRWNSSWRHHFWSWWNGFKIFQERNMTVTWNRKTVKLWLKEYGITGNL